MTEDLSIRFKIKQYYNALKKEMDEFIEGVKMEKTHTEYDSLSKEDKLPVICEITKLPRYIALKTMLITIEQLAEKCEIYLDKWELDI